MEGEDQRDAAPTRCGHRNRDGCEVFAQMHMNKVDTCGQSWSQGGGRQAPQLAHFPNRESNSDYRTLLSKRVAAGNSGGTRRQDRLRHTEIIEPSSERSGMALHPANGVEAPGL